MFEDAAAGADDTQVAIMRATFRALQKHGYAGLSIQRIADETDLSKSTFYHHYEGKDDLLLSFLEFVLGQFTEDLARLDTGDPRRDLALFFDAVLFDTHPLEAAGEDIDYDCPGERTIPDEAERSEMKATVMELRSHAIRDARYREQFLDADDRVRDRLATIIERGVDQGVFDDVDATRTADLLLTLAYGALLRPSTSAPDGDPPEVVREEIASYVDDHLLRTS